MLHKIRCKLLSVSVAVLWILLPSVAYAHATPVLYEPGLQAQLPSDATEVRIRFSERIEPLASFMKVLAPDGSAVSTSKAVVDQTDPHWVSVPIRGAGNGTYSVSWQVISADDGHFTKGAYFFSIGEHAHHPMQHDMLSHVEHHSSLLEGFTVFLELIGQGLLGAAVVLIILIWRPLRTRWKLDTSGLNSALERRLGIAMTCAGLLIIIGVAWYLAILSGELAQEQGVRLGEAFQIITKTTAGSFALSRAAIGTLIALILLCTRKTILRSVRITGWEILALVGFILISLARARVSHAAASLFMPEISVATTFLHVMFKNLWVAGGLLIVAVILPVLHSCSPRIVGLTRTTFSLFTNVALAMMGITGTYMVWLHLKSLSNLFTSQWGARFIALSLVAGVWVTVHLYNQLIGDRKVVSQGKTGTRILRIEALCGIGALFVSSLLVITTPPLTMPSDQSMTSEGVHMVLSDRRDMHGDLLLNIREVPGTDLAPVESVSVLVQEKVQGLGPFEVEVTLLTENQYSVPTSVFSVPGSWELETMVRRQNAYDAHATFPIEHPLDLAAKSAERHFDLFGMLLIMAGLGSVGMSAVLFQISYRFRKTLLS